MSKAVFYDRDGIILKLIYDNENGRIETAKNPSQIDFIPGIFELLKHTAALGYKNIITSNQAGVGLQKISEENFNAVKTDMTNILKNAGAVIDAQYYCFHHPSASLEKYRSDCDCRKPKPGMLLQAAKENDIDVTRSWMIGDSVNDVLAGHSAGCKTILVANLLESEYLRLLEKELQGIKPDFMVKTLEEIINII